MCIFGRAYRIGEIVAVTLVPVDLVGDELLPMQTGDFWSTMQAT